MRRVSRALCEGIPSSCYGLISPTFLSLQFLANCPYFLYNQHSVSVFSWLNNCPSPAFTPYRLFYISYWWIKYKWIYIQVPCYHAQFRSQCIQQSMNQFSNTQRSVTTVALDELWWSSVSIKLPHILIIHVAEAKCSLSAAAAVWVHSVACAEGVGGIENSAVGAGLS